MDRHSDALPLLEQPGDVVLVVRGVPRMMVFACPDGCGDILPVNLDARADKAWRYYKRNGVNTLYPSVWRDEGCQAHFILWNDLIYWDGLGHGFTPPAELRKLVLSELSNEEFRTPFEIAVGLDEIPWAVSVTCDGLVGEGLAEEAPGKKKGSYRLRSNDKFALEA